MRRTTSGLNGARKRFSLKRSQIRPDLQIRTQTPRSDLRNYTLETQARQPKHRIYDSEPKPGSPNRQVHTHETQTDEYPS
jgi:hypothetical protein